MIGKISYIRHIYGGNRFHSDSPSVFSPMTEPHQDVLRFSNMIDGNSVICTVGKQIFPKNLEQPNSPSRWTVIVVVEGDLFIGKDQLSKTDRIRFLKF